jgi:ankyrin repeat protein
MGRHRKIKPSAATVQNYLRLIQHSRFALTLLRRGHRFQVIFYIVVFNKFSKDTDLLQMLPRGKSMINQVDHMELTPLALAVRGNFLPLVDALLQLGADTEIADTLGTISKYFSNVSLATPRFSLVGQLQWRSF